MQLSDRHRPDGVVLPEDERVLRALVRGLDFHGVRLTPELVRGVGVIVRHWPRVVERDEQGVGH